MNVRSIPLGFFAALVVAMSACAGPQKYIDNAQIIINESRKVNAKTYSPERLKEAREHLAKAIQARSNEKEDLAVRYAMQAEQIGFDAYYVSIDQYVKSYNQKLKTVRQNALRHDANQVVAEKFNKGQTLYESISNDMEKVEKLKKKYQNSVTDEESLEQKNEKRKQIVSNLKEIRDQSQSAIRYFSDAAETAIQREKSARQKLGDLAGAIGEAKKDPAVDEASVQSAVKFQRQAEKEFKNFAYANAEDTAAEGLHQLSSSPFVSLQLDGHLFSPGPSNPNDSIEIQPKVFSVNPIAGYEISIHTADGKENESLVKEWSGEGRPPESVSWDGEGEDGKVLASSAENYFVRLKVMDEKENEAVSRDVKFKTDIFANETDRGLVMDVSSIRFRYNEARLTRDDKRIAERVRSYLREFPDYRIVIEGHTDATGSAKSNRILARKRAGAVADYMKKLGMEEDRFLTYGMGEVLPLTLDSRKIGINRRVSFILLKEKGDVKEYEEFRNKKNLDRGVIMKNTEALSDYPPVQQ